MQTNKRTIREAVKTLLLNKTNAGKQVFASRVLPNWVQDLPVINIFADSESIERFNESPKSYRRTLSLNIEITAKGSDETSLDENLDEIGDLVETLMEVDETLGGCVNQLEITGTDYDYQEETQDFTGSLTLRYAVEYFTDALVLGQQCLDNLNEVHIDYKIGHHAGPSDEVIDAEDEIKNLGGSQ